MVHERPPGLDIVGFIFKQIRTSIYTFTTLIIRAMFPEYVELFLNIQVHIDNSIIVISILSCMYLRVRANHV